MAYATSSRPAEAAGAAAGLFDRLARMLRRRKVYRATVRELSALTTRELSDLGIPRSMITRVALEAARNAD